jgi:branched-chain amino acid transport system permease protein
MTNFLSDYAPLIISMLLGALLGISLYLPLMTGQLSLASPGFYAIGGYIAAILSTTVFKTTGLYPLSGLALEIFMAALVSGILGLIVGIPVLRLRGIYLAIATIAFVEVLRILSLNLEITGGAVGIFGIPQPFNTTLEYLWIVLPLLIMSGVILYRLENIRVGKAFTAIREDELAAAAMGINPTYYKVLAFTLGAMVAGITGVVSAHFLNTWNARQGTFDASIVYLTSVLIGGTRTFVGPILGGMVFTALPEVLRALANLPNLPLWLVGFLKDGRLIIFGILIVIGTLFFPKGLVTPELLSAVSAWIKSLYHKMMNKIINKKLLPK